MPSRIFVVENHPSFSRVLQLMLSRQLDFEVCGSAETGEDAIAKIADIKPDLALIDLSLPGISGLDVIRRVKQLQPSVRCAVLTGHEEHEYLERSIEAGADGYIVKGSPEEIIEGIRLTAAGQTFYSTAAH